MSLPYSGLLGTLPAARAGGGASEASVCRVEAVQGGGAVAARQGAVLLVADILQGEEVLLERRR